MTPQDKAKRKQAHQSMIERYGDWLSHMLTITFHQEKNGKSVTNTGWNKGVVNQYESILSTEKATQTIKHIITVLNYKLWGHKSRKDKTKDRCQIIAIPILEGLASNKNTHAHILLGNIPKNKLEQLSEIITEIIEKESWTFGYDLREIHDSDGAAFYCTKEIGYLSEDSILWQESKIPDRLVKGCTRK